ncbi:hypothetical protein HAX54_043620, partial [Datura stramonium]|nr:hypothetical protein [Datura stramonium]
VAFPLQQTRYGGCDPSWPTQQLALFLPLYWVNPPTIMTRLATAILRPLQQSPLINNSKFLHKFLSSNLSINPTSPTLSTMT